MKLRYLLFAVSTAGLISCNNDESQEYVPVDPYANIKATFGNAIDPDNLANYEAQAIPAYITRDNTAGNPVTDKGAMLGRVLFYDKNLSANNTVSCASCHNQANAFSDAKIASEGINGTTERHAMRLVNERFGTEQKFFWDERAATLELQTTMPVKNHGEMGFSGENGDASFSNLLDKLSEIGYYKELFSFVYGSEEITEAKIQSCLAQFIRSIQSFDSKYDAGRAAAPNDGAPFANFTQQENAGKQLFMAPPVFDASGNRTAGGLGCAGCHKAPEFDIDPNSLNNGVITKLGVAGFDILNTRSPSLRNALKPDGSSNGTFMHTGEFNSIEAVLGHYNVINVSAVNTNLDPRLNPTGNGVHLNLTQAEINSVTAFIKTLSGSNVYTDVKWSDPF
ncbi:cytochrome-c peroxidase [Flavobacterium sp. RHBU_24]|uniref:cytochrome-c peroxidase n=1 Tax=Flavobacterium sp. RHBU_24 TaxID=3391185 RepID=UPI003984C951